VHGALGKYSENIAKMGNFKGKMRKNKLKKREIRAKMSEK
jgi:hypothetical protein